MCVSEMQDEDYLGEKRGMEWGEEGDNTIKQSMMKVRWSGDS